MEPTIFVGIVSGDQPVTVPESIYAKALLDHPDAIHWAAPQWQEYLKTLPATTTEVVAPVVEETTPAAPEPAQDATAQVEKSEPTQALKATVSDELKVEDQATATIADADQPMTSAPPEEEGKPSFDTVIERFAEDLPAPIPHGRV